MGGKRVAMQGAAGAGTAVEERPRKRGRKVLWIALSMAAALALGGTLGVCAYANSYDRVFPSVTLGGQTVSGLTREELTGRASPEALLQGSVVITADGQELGCRTQEELGAQVDSMALTEAVWRIGRAEGPLGWLKNGWTMLRCRLGAGFAVPVAVSGFDGAALRQTAAELAAGFDQAPVDGSYALTREGLFATKPCDGRLLDQQGLVRSLSAMDGAAGEAEAPWAVVAAQPLDMEAIRALDAEAAPTRYDKETGRVVEGTVGVSVDLEAVIFVLDAAAPGETVQLPAEIVYPEMTAAELEAVLFRDVLGTATTTVTGTSSRKGNVRLAGEAVDGTVLNAGDVFDYNEVVGRRTVERGFGPAPSYINGQTVDSIGGGICQVSSTLYLSALLSDLEIVTRSNHRFLPSYIDPGMDATVSWGGPEFRFKNDTAYPIRIDVTYADGQLTVTLLGTKTDDTYVKMTYQEIGSTPYSTVYEESDALPYGTQQEAQNGYVGRKVETYRNVYSGDGTLLSSTLEAVSNYSSRDRIVLVGTAGRPEASDTGEEDVPTGGQAATPGTEDGGTDGTPGLGDEDTMVDPETAPEDGSLDGEGGAPEESEAPEGPGE